MRVLNFIIFNSTTKMISTKNVDYFFNCKIKYSIKYFTDELKPSIIIIIKKSMAHNGATGI